MAEFVQNEDEIPEKRIFNASLDEIHLTKTGSRSAEMSLPSRKKYETQIAKPFLIKTDRITRQLKSPFLYVSSFRPKPHY